MIRQLVKYYSFHPESTWDLRVRMSVMKGLTVGIQTTRIAVIYRAQHRSSTDCWEDESQIVLQWKLYYRKCHKQNVSEPPYEAHGVSAPKCSFARSAAERYSTIVNQLKLRNDGGVGFGRLYNNLALSFIEVDLKEINFCALIPIRATKANLVLMVIFYLSTARSGACRDCSRFPSLPLRWL